MALIGFSSKDDIDNFIDIIKSVSKKTFFDFNTKLKVYSILARICAYKLLLASTDIKYFFEHINELPKEFIYELEDSFTAIDITAIKETKY